METGRSGSGWLPLLVAAAMPALWGAPPAGAQEVVRVAEIGSPFGGTLLSEEARRAELSRIMAEKARALEASFAWEEAAPMYERAALLSDSGDPGSVGLFVSAGRCYYYAYRPDRASRMWEAAGHRAALHDDTPGAAISYMKASLAAREAGDAERSSLNGLRARALADSPDLTDEQRAWIRERVRMRTVVVGERP